MSEGSVWSRHGAAWHGYLYKVSRPLPLYFKVSPGICPLFIGPSLILLVRIRTIDLYMHIPNVLVPIAGQREALLLKDAKTLAKNMVKQLPASRHGEAGEAIAEAFLVEAKMQK